MTGVQTCALPISRGVAERFQEALVRTATAEDDVLIEHAGDAPPPVQGGRQRPGNNRPNAGAPPSRGKYAPKPYRKTNDRNRRP